ncbi:MAG: O-antigen ligase family protein, partial [Bacteroidales bacterium]|nr:O-antigen ligase family protein [Bacteroidales bacterium]
MIFNRLFEYLIFICLALILIIDSLNGFFLKSLELNIPISKIFKLFLQFIIVVYFFSLNAKRFLYFIILLMALFLPVILNILIFSNNYNIIETILQLDKFIFVVLVYYLMVELIERGRQHIEANIRKILVINFYVLIINMLLGLIGLGHKQYTVGNSGIGIRGFFYAGNEMTGLIFILFTYILFLSYQRYSKKIYYLISLI